MNKHLLFSALAFVILVIIGAYAWSERGEVPVVCTMEAKFCPDGSAVGRSGPKCEFAPCPSGYETYKNDTYGISFGYPSSYVLSEREAGNGERRHYVIALVDKKDAANIPKNGEGPTAITIDLYQNDLDKMSINDFVTGTNDSNYKLSVDQKITTTTVAGKEALSYTWDGLYRGESVVFHHRGNIVKLSVTYFTPEDKIRGDFTKLASSIALH